MKPQSVTNMTTTVKGHATKYSKIRVSRYSTLYASGKATKQGTFNFKLRHSLKAGTHIKFTVTKKGYKTVKVSLLVKKFAQSLPTKSKKITSSAPTTIITATNGTSTTTSPNSYQNILKSLLLVDQETLSSSTSQLTTAEAQDKYWQPAGDILDGNTFSQAQAFLDEMKTRLITLKNQDQSNPDTAKETQQLTTNISNYESRLNTTATILKQFNGDESAFHTAYQANADKIYSLSNTIDSLKAQITTLQQQIANN
ncbi:Ig-like domain-containing protein [Levilactobacillus brevis]|uniref:Ig-like domain-containing protein n=1 Tax=Levilactobacillus brevis TaxID=1580 RepID=UPI002987FE69|nr:Ig-like domain-containing protein [Levilactobacillus brevis]